MGWKLKRKELCGNEQMKPNEEKEITIELEKETRAAIHGIVKKNGKPVEGAVVKLFMKKNPHDPCSTCDLIPVTFTFTDDCGQFLFGVESGIDFIIKVFYFKPETIKHQQCDHRNEDY